MSTPFTIRLAGPITDVAPKRTPDLFDMMNLPPVNNLRFFNTTGETGATLATYRAKASAQDRRILAIMEDLGMASPSQVWAAMDKSCPITSVRRAMTNLTSAGMLVKMDHKVMGAFGRPEHVWQIVTP